jgi:hypothetical protein
MIERAQNHVNPPAATEIGRESHTPGRIVVFIKRSAVNSS